MNYTIYQKQQKNVNGNGNLLRNLPRSSRSELKNSRVEASGRLHCSGNEDQMIAECVILGVWISESNKNCFSFGEKNELRSAIKLQRGLQVKPKPQKVVL